ncbi:MAG: MoxR family ATPase [Conexivisphaerales archaeon]
MQSDVEGIVEEVSRFVVGKKEVIETLLTALIAEGHVLLEGPPGVAKTLIAKTFAMSIGSTFRRIQFTPDLLPSDIIGTSVFNPKDSTFSIKQGPIFANIVMADELNRATARTQSAMLEAMQERQVTIEGNTFHLPRPFMTIATQVPFGGAGTYPLSDVQIDRFSARVSVNYPSFDEEKMVMASVDSIDKLDVRARVKSDDIVKAIEASKNVLVSEPVRDYIAKIVFNIRRDTSVRLGPSPRASVWLYKMSRARAFLLGRSYVLPDDVKSLVPYVLAHRIILTSEAETDSVKPEKILEEVLVRTEVPKE